MIITIDGPAAAGKSTVARALAKRLGVDYLDTGAMYRAATWKALADGVDTDDPTAVARAAAESKIQLVQGRGGTCVLCDGRDVTGEIRKPAVTQSVFRLADQPDVRRALIRHQRLYARGRDLVTEGRDQGTDAFPDAEVKFYLDASLETRAQRRLKDLRSLGAETSLDEVRGQIADRDRTDKARPVGSLRRSSDMIGIDSTRMTVEEVVRRMAQIVEQRQPAPPRLDSDSAGRPVMDRGGVGACLQYGLYSACRCASALVVTLCTGVRHFNVPDIRSVGGLLIASNHQSYFDPVLVGMVFERPIHFLAQEGLFRVPGFGRLIGALGAHRIRRGQVDASAVRTALRILRGGGALLLFPEGTRSVDGSLGEFKQGVGAIAVHCGVPVLPVCIEGAFECWPRSRLFPMPGRVAVAFGDFLSPRGMDAATLNRAMVRRVAILQGRLRSHLGRRARESVAGEARIPRDAHRTRCPEQASSAQAAAADGQGGGNDARDG